MSAVRNDIAALSVRLTLAAIFVLPITTSSHAAAKPELWAKWQQNDPASRQKIDYGVWDEFLKKYVVAPHPSGINRVRYATVTPEDRAALKNYLAVLQSVAISSYNRREQEAYWINLYNALIVDLALARFPVSSIRDINISPGLMVRGPWAAKLVSIEGERVSLDDIEHRILRPIWKDNRIHYALNWASLGSANLQPSAYTGDNTEALLERGAREFINHPRGVEIKNGRLKVSSLYAWFDEDFGGSAEGLMGHWQKYATGHLADSLSKYSGGLEHDYDWRLNAVGPEPQP
jgi:hypothetical protein